MMELWKENIRQSTLTQTNMMVKNGLCEKVSFQLRDRAGVEDLKKMEQPEHRL